MTKNRLASLAPRRLENADETIERQSTMAKDLDKMDKDELQEEYAAIQTRMKAAEKAMDEYDDRRKAELRDKWAAEAEEAGYSLSDVIGEAPKKRGRGGAKSSTKGEPKYRHPENPDKTWTGKGRQPAWFKEHVDNGGNPEDLAA